MSTFSAVKQNIKAQAPMQADKRERITQPRCCWKCQKDKQTFGGKIVISPGLFMFVCKDCLDAKKAA